jgi:hypothetical protein
MSQSLKKIINSLPISKFIYFLHFLLIIDILLILIRISYMPFIHENFLILTYVFDLIIITVWGLDFIKKIYSKENKLNYLQSRWYNILGLFPFPLFRFFLLLNTLKLSIIVYKFIKSNKQDFSSFKDKELNFSFRDYFIDSISDAIFLRSLERVKEVVIRLDFQELASKSLENNQANLYSLIKSSIDSKIKSNILFTNSIANNFSEQLTNIVLNILKEILQNKIAGDITKDLNLLVIEEMDKHVRQLDLDRIITKSEDI